MLVSVTLIEALAVAAIALMVCSLPARYRTAANNSGRQHLHTTVTEHKIELGHFHPAQDMQTQKMSMLNIVDVNTPVACLTRLRCRNQALTDVWGVTRSEKGARTKPSWDDLQAPRDAVVAAVCTQGGPAPHLSCHTMFFQWLLCHPALP
jgi:hypothetical protein